MNLTFSQFMNQLAAKPLESFASDVKSLAIGIFEPLDTCLLRFAIDDTNCKAFQARLQNIPLMIEHPGQYILSAQALSFDDSMNSHFPGEFSYGGGFLFEDLINSKDVELKLEGYPNDQYAKQELKRMVSMKDFSYGSVEVFVALPQKVEAFVNGSDQFKFADCGMIKNSFQTINFRTLGLWNLISLFQQDIEQVFVGGTPGKLQAFPDQLRFFGDFKKMDTLYVSGLSLKGYGVFLALGLGVSIAINGSLEKLKKVQQFLHSQVSVLDIATRHEVTTVPLQKLLDPVVEWNGHAMKTASLTSMYMCERIAERVLEQKNKNNI